MSASGTVLTSRRAKDIPGKLSRDEAVLCWALLVGFLVADNGLDGADARHADVPSERVRDGACNQSEQHDGASQCDEGKRTVRS